MTISYTLDEFIATVGTHLGYSEWLTIDQQRIDAFAEVTGDHQWIHVNPEKAKDSTFGSTIAHGFLTMSLTPLLGGQIFEVTPVSSIINYGLDKARFPAPVLVNSRIRAGAELISAVEKSGGVQVTIRMTIEIDGSERPALVADTVRIMYR